MNIMDLKQENEQLKKENQELRQTLEVAMREIKSLKDKLDQNSRNSHWPSSRDKGKKPKRTRSLRQKSDKKPGGQKGHQGHTVKFSEHPDEVIPHRPANCDQCQKELTATDETIAVQKRQVHDLPPIEIVVTQHEAETVLCQGCGHQTAGLFPEEVTNPVQYGKRIKQLALYLKHQQLIPYGRSQQFFADLFDLSLSPGTLQNMTRKGADAIEPVQAKIKAALEKSDVIHLDESGCYIGGERHWLHVTSTPHLTYYRAHKSRGRLALNEIEILLNFTGTAIHDNWASYWGYDCDHGLCNVHHLRELKAVEQNDAQVWANRFALFLLAVKARVKEAKLETLTCLPPDAITQIERLYTQLVDQALRANAPPENGWPAGKRGRAKKTKACNLAERFEKRQNEILRFAYDFKVPFDNNLAERDIRMLKVQQKISGCFRSQQGADDFFAIRSYISTIRKQGLSVWDALGSLFSDQVIMPQLTPV
jgi:transposase